MRAVIQRVARARVTIAGTEIAAIGPGLVALVAVARNDARHDFEWMARKIVGLRVFDDADGKMNLSLRETEGRLLVVSQFTLYGDCRKGRRPSYSDAAPPDVAESMYVEFLGIVRELVPDLQTGRFQAAMEVEILNSGPVTLILDSPGRPVSMETA